ncbi:hypothetical protein GGX14DRAFT_401492 [Mycena pura]|uniref:Uncharacterized protein n=1 Tax=Mycena pura TaxID=153505 RepID=A0AAD6V0L1_9AGAR|nr:hypothetical protein GGX14DRAFT_401492 [Mycena pura]
MPLNLLSGDKIWIDWAFCRLERGLVFTSTWKSERVRTEIRHQETVQLIGRRLAALTKQLGKCAVRVFVSMMVLVRLRRPFISLTAAIKPSRCCDIAPSRKRGSQTGREERSRARVQRDKERVFKAAAESVDGVWVFFALMGLNILLNAFNRCAKLGLYQTWRGAESV